MQQKPIIRESNLHVWKPKKSYLLFTICAGNLSVNKYIKPKQDLYD